MVFIVSASPILVDRGIYRALLDEAGRQGQRAAGTAATIRQGSILTNLAATVMGIQIDRPLIRKEWESRCPWPAVIWVGAS